MKVKMIARQGVARMLMVLAKRAWRSKRVAEEVSAFSIVLLAIAAMGDSLLFCGAALLMAGAAMEHMLNIK